MTDDNKSIISRITDKLFELNGNPVKTTGKTPEYGFFKDPSDKSSKFTPHQFRIFQHENEDKDPQINSIVYIGISNQPYQNYKQKHFDNSIKEGEFIHKVIDELFEQQKGVQINYENGITQVIISKDNIGAAQILQRAVGDVIREANRRGREQLHTASDVKFYYPDVNLGARTQSFTEHASGKPGNNIGLIYNHSPALGEAALAAMRG